jgi:hypothetical protein
MKNRLRKFSIGLLAVGFVACGGSAKSIKPAESITDNPQNSNVSSDDASRCEYKGRPDREAKESAGLGSIRPNIRRVYAIVGEGDERKRVLLCREVDTNLDGAKDVVRTFNDKGESLRELADSDYDGKIDTWVTFAAGRMAKVEIDTNHDGSPDEFRYYVKGKLARMQRDTNADGRPDIWEIYEDGELRRMGHDIDHDGHVDRWDRDEIAERAAIEHELREEEKQKQERSAAANEASGTAGAGGKSSTDGKSTDPKKNEPVKGHVSPRKR